MLNGGMMIRDKFVVFAGLLLLILATTFFAITWSWKPPQNESLMLAQANGSLNGTISDDFFARINVSIIPPVSIIPDNSLAMNDSYSPLLALKILRINTIVEDYIGGDYEPHQYKYTTFDVLVLRSNDPAFKECHNYTFEIYQEMADLTGAWQEALPL